MSDADAPEPGRAPGDRGDAKTIEWRSAQADDRAEATVELPAALDFESRYTQLDLIGEGGMGRVTRCTDRQIGRNVAVKCLLRARPGAEEASRFVREARLQARLEHPSVVPVYDLGVDAEGHPWFSMKHVSGVTLAEVIERMAAGEHSDAWSRRRLLTAISQVCLAVDFAHRHGIIHRDLKPDNVMLGEYGEVYVLDWGLAKQVLASGASPSPDAASEGTTPGLVRGTPGYMAPEQIRGDRPTPATDVYALGSVLFEVLTLQPLLPSVDPATVLTAMLDGIETRPSVRVPSRPLEPELEAIVVKALHPEPEHRFRSARALSRALDTFLDGQRDEELRRRLAFEHAQTAARLLRGDDPDRRRHALRAIGRALALDPDDPEATAVLRGILTRPPAERPAAVERALARSAAIQHGWIARAGVPAYLSMLLFFPILAWAGIRSVAALLPFFVAMLGAGIISHIASRGGTTRPRQVMVVMVLSNIGIACTTTIFGPLLVLPAIAAVNGAAFALTFRSRRRRLISGVCALLAMLIPLGLELAGVLAPSYRFTAEGLLVLPQAVALPEAATLTILTLAGIATIATGVVTLGRVQVALTRIEERLYTHTWQVQQLLPDVGPDARSVSMRVAVGPR